MNRTQKAEVVDLLREDFAAAQSLVLSTYQNVDVNTINELRSKLRAEGVHFRQVKNTLAKIAVRGTEMEPIADLFVGPTVVAYSREDAVAPAKLLKEFAKGKEESFEIRGGFLAGQALAAQSVDALASMPSKEEMQAKFLGLLQAVPSKFLRTLNAAPQQFLLVLKAKADKDGETQAAA